MALSFEYPDFTSLHDLAQPFDVFNRHPGIFATVANNHRPSDVDIPEANSMSSFETDEQVHSWIRVRRGKIPDRMC